MPRGGRREGSGRKKKIRAESVVTGEVTDYTPHEYMLGVMNGKIVPDEVKFRAAVAAAPYSHAKLEKAAQSKKDELAQNAKDAGAGKFATPAAPKLVVNNQ